MLAVGGFSLTWHMMPCAWKIARHIPGMGLDRETLKTELTERAKNYDLPSSENNKQEQAAFKPFFDCLDSYTGIAIYSGSEHYFRTQHTADIVHSKNVLLYAPRRILQGFDILPNGEIYYSQVGSNAYTLNICRAAGPNQNAQDEVMILKHFGHGTQIVAEKASDGKTYIWLNSNASVDDSGEYGNNWSFSRVEFVPGTNEADGYAGDTFFLNKEQQYDQQVAVDFDARRLLVGSRKSGVRHFWIFDLDEVLALPLKEMTVSVTVGGGTGDSEKQTVERKIMGHDLNDCRVLGNFSFSAGTDKEHDVYSYSHQGHEINGDYIYFYEGNAVENSDDPGTYQSKAYVTVFNYNGRIVVPRTEVAAIADVNGLASEGFTQTGYAEGECIKVKEGKLYLGMACRDGSSSNRYANILVYDCVKKQ
mgnify:CR=1 FL=1